MKKQFRNVGQIGIVLDTDPFNLNPDAWSEGNNVRFKEGRIEKMLGQTSVFAATTATAQWAMPVLDGANYFWVYPSLTKCHVTDGGSHFNITRQTTLTSATVVDVNYTGTATDRWNGGVISGIPVLTNGVDVPQMWNPINTGGSLTALTYNTANTWAGVSYTAKVIRPFKQFLVALDINKSGTRYPHMVKWSDQADSGAVPASWDETDTTILAGEVDLSDTNGYLVDCLPMGDTNIIYKEDCTWGMDLINTSEVFKFYKLFSQSGLLAVNCVAEIEGRHVCLTSNDVVIHDGRSMESILDKKMRRALFNDIDATNYKTSYVAPNYPQNEIWICYPSSGSTLPDKAIVWNYRDNTTSIRDIPSSPFMSWGIVNVTAQSKYWVDYTAQTWDTFTSPWGEVSFNAVELASLISSGAQFYKVDLGDTFGGTNMTAYIQKESLDFDEPFTVKRIKRVYPQIESAGTLTISIGTQMKKTDGISWTNYTFDPSTDEKLDVRESGRFISIKIASSGSSPWTFHSFDIEYESGGRN